ncbi:hypothetical protein EDC04DRAFT_2760396 [Pisolithus marmoratus]|nr:hypothetical protein EDC04DRAFT_2760396 [Pisolithus marmoratus]
MEIGVGMNVMLAIDVDGTIVVLAVVISSSGRLGIFATGGGLLLVFGISGDGLIIIILIAGGGMFIYIRWWHIAITTAIRGFFVPGYGIVSDAVIGAHVDVSSPDSSGIPTVGDTVGNWVPSLAEVSVGTFGDGVASPRDTACRLAG